MTIGGRMLVAVGAVLLIAAAASGWSAFRLVTTAHRATGVVVRSAPDAPGDRSPGHPLIQFTTADGRTSRAPQHSGASVPYGTRLTVLYRAADPEGATMLSFGSLWAVPLLLAWLGLALFIGPFFGMRPVLRA